MSPIAPIPEVRVPDPVSRHAGIGEASRNVLVRFVVDVFNRIKDSLSALIRHAIEHTMESLEREALEMTSGAFDRILAMPDLPADVRQILVSTRSGDRPVGAAVALSAAVAIAVAIFPAAVSGFMGHVRNASFRVFRPGLLDAAARLSYTVVSVGLDDPVDSR